MDLKYMFDKFNSVIKNPVGVCALMGNIKAESNYNPKNLQNNGNRKLNLTDDEFVRLLDSGKYSKQKFLYDGFGFGLVQWTYWSRKAAFYDYVKKTGKSFGNLDAQISYCLKELKGYSKVWKAVTEGSDLKEISDIILTQYERPADQSDRVKEMRAGYGYEVLNTILVEKTYSRDEIVKLAKSWLGKKESDGSHKEIIDVYNTQNPLPRGYKVTYTDAWCATFVTALAVKLGYTDIFPCECSCNKMIELAKNMGIWNETDSYIPKPGDLILYDWDDKGNGDNEGYADHVGLVEVSTDKSFKVIEGNYSNSVKRCNMNIDGLKIRGFICPAYSEESVDIDKLARDVIAGKYGNGQERKDKLGKLYSKVQKRVNEMLK